MPVVTRYDYGSTGFSAAHLGDADLHSWHTPAGLVTGVRALLGPGERFVYAYYEGIDKVAHARGLGEYYDDELRYVDRLVGDVLGVLPPGAVLVVTADHGQVEVGGAVEVLGGDVMDGVTLISGEGRFRWLHARPGRRRPTWRRRRGMPSATWPGCGRRTRSSKRDGWVASLRPPCRPAWATSSWPRSRPPPSSTRRTPASSACWPATARSPPTEMLIPLLSWPSA